MFRRQWQTSPIWRRLSVSGPARRLRPASPVLWSGTANSTARVDDMNPTVEDEMRYRLLRYFEQHPHASQRELARELGISVGKVNYCLRALIQRGWVKMRNFRDSTNKLAYTYTLTSKGIEERVSVASRFL